MSCIDCGKPGELISAPVEPKPDAICAYHWPRVVLADFWDANGLACCNQCGCQWDRVCRMPKFAMKAAP